MTLLSFNSVDVLHALESASAAALDEASFGILTLSEAAVVLSYNAWEARASGLAAARVIGKHFFTRVAPCANNALVAARYEASGPLDVVIDYVFAWRLQATKVRLRLLKPGIGNGYLLVERR